MNNFDHENFHKNILEEREAEASTHAPGPWTIGGKNEIHVWDRDGNHVASCSKRKNAPLVAAAPDLLKALMRYGSHDNSCNAANPTSEEKHECSCGLWKAQAIFKVRFI